jgi:glucose-6-phosphate 1-dehydrogenase
VIVRTPTARSTLHCPAVTAYPYLIQQVLESDPMLFIRGDETLEAPRIIDRVMAAWSTRDLSMYEYAAGTAPTGPA